MNKNQSLPGLFHSHTCKRETEGNGEITKQSTQGSLILVRTPDCETKNKK